MPLTVQIEHAAEVRAALGAHAGPLTVAESKAIAVEVSRLVQRHLRTRDTRNPHRYPAGGRRTHFWAKAAEAVSWEADRDGVTVRVHHEGVHLRYAGAPQGIRPVNAGALAIPARAESYGRSPADFGDLRVVVFKRSGKAALLPADKRQGLAPLFWLVKHTRPIPPDPTVMPQPNVILGLAVHRLRTMRERAGGSAATE